MHEESQLNRIGVKHNADFEMCVIKQLKFPFIISSCSVRLIISFEKEQKKYFKKKKKMHGYNVTKT